MSPLRIVVLCGGWSAEREVSLVTGRHVADALRELGHEVALWDLTRNRVSRLIEDLRKWNAEVVFLALHGTPGEDGSVQGLLELAGIPYTGSGVLASALALEKPVAKEIFVHHGIPTPEWRVLREDETFAGILELGLPVVTKPPNQGSTVGTRIVRSTEELPSAVAEALEFGERVLVERYIPGRELSVGVLGEEVLEVVEILPKADPFYSYRAKYEPGGSEKRVPAPLPREVRARVRELALRAHQVLGCRGATRVDFRLSPEMEPFVLEVNTIPGLTPESLLPLSAAPMGYDFPALVQRMVELALQARREVAVE